ncbi:hypothetical protein GCM10022420_081740 [Streptomyces iranensis]
MPVSPTAITGAADVEADGEGDSSAAFCAGFDGAAEVAGPSTSGPSLLSEQPTRTTPRRATDAALTAYRDVRMESPQGSRKRLPKPPEKAKYARKNPGM